MLIDGLLIERVERCDLRGAARRTHPFRDGLKLLRGSPGEEHLRSLAGERLSDRAADGAGAAVDHRILPFEQHQCLLILDAGPSTAEPTDNQLTVRPLLQTAPGREAHRGPVGPYFQFGPACPIRAEPVRRTRPAPGATTATAGR